MTLTARKCTTEPQRGPNLGQRNQSLSVYEALTPPPANSVEFGDSARHARFRCAVARLHYPARALPGVKSTVAESDVRRGGVRRAGERDAPLLSRPKGSQRQSLHRAEGVIAPPPYAAPCPFFATETGRSLLAARQHSARLDARHRRAVRCRLPRVRKLRPAPAVLGPARRRSWKRLPLRSSASTPTTAPATGRLQTPSISRPPAAANYITLYNSGILTAADDGIDASTTGNNSFITIENVGDHQCWRQWH